MKGPITLTFMLLASSLLSHGQTVPGFFAPAARAQHAANAGGILAIETLPQSSTAGGTSGNVTWDHASTGYVGLNLVVAQAHLRPFTETTGSSLVFGRELSSEVILIGGSLDAVLNPVLGANAITTWRSEATLSGLSIAANQLYEVTFNVTPGAGLPVELLGTVDFGISTAGIQNGTGGSATTLDVLGLITVSNSLVGDTARYTFMSTTARTELDFYFEAQTLVGLSLLGGTNGNRDVLTFSNLAITPIPEPSVSALAALFGGMFLIARRRK